MATGPWRLPRRRAGCFASATAVHCSTECSWEPVPESADKVVEIGSTDVMTYGDTLLVYARVRGLRRGPGAPSIGILVGLRDLRKRRRPGRRIPGP